MGKRPWGWTLRISSPERAILEALDELPDHESFHNLDMIFEGLTTLSPRWLEALLRSCRKNKVKWLFLSSPTVTSTQQPKTIDYRSGNLAEIDV